MQKWEYQTTQSASLDGFLQEANYFGAEGWEIIQVERTHGHLFAFMKRPKEEKRDETGNSDNSGSKTTESDK